VIDSSTVREMIKEEFGVRLSSREMAILGHYYGQVDGMA